MAPSPPASLLEQDPLLSLSLSLSLTPHSSSHPLSLAPTLPAHTSAPVSTRDSRASQGTEAALPPPEVVDASSSAADEELLQKLLLSRILANASPAAPLLSGSKGISPAETKAASLTYQTPASDQGPSTFPSGSPSSSSPILGLVPPSTLPASSSSSPILLPSSLTSPVALPSPHDQASSPLPAAAATPSPTAQQLTALLLLEHRQRIEQALQLQQQEKQHEQQQEQQQRQQQQLELLRQQQLLQAAWLLQASKMASREMQGESSQSPGNHQFLQPTTGNQGGSLTQTAEQGCSRYHPAWDNTQSGPSAALEGAAQAQGVAGEQEEGDMSSGGDKDGGGRKKMALSREEVGVLEEAFKKQPRPSLKQKESIAKKLNVSVRQIEVWFQNRRARTKVKQTEVEVEALRRRCIELEREKERLQRELQASLALPEPRSCLQCVRRGGQR